MMEAEDYVGAVHYYEKAMTDDPGDTEVATKLYEARTRMVMANLIKVRLQRQSNQHRAAALQLNKSLHNIKRWKIIADSGVKATINEEVLEGGTWLNKELQSLADRSDHNGFFYSLKQFNYILDAGYADQTVRTHKPALLKQGQQQCQNMKAQLTPQAYYLYDVWLAYCGVFSIQGQYRLAKDTSRYSQPDVSSKRLKISTSAGISASHISRDIERGIDQHPWFSRQAVSPMVLPLSGRISYSLFSEPKTFTRKFMVFDDTLELIKDPKNSNNVIQKLIKRKKVEKTVKFKGREYTEVASHSVMLRAKVAEFTVNASSQQAKQKTIIPTHNTYFKEQGITPLRAKFKNKQSWKNTITNNINKQLNNQLDQAWIEAFCTNQKIAKGLSVNEHAVRCSVIKPNHGMVTAWLNKDFGLTLPQLNTMLN